MCVRMRYRSGLYYFNDEQRRLFEASNLEMFCQELAPLVNPRTREWSLQLPKRIQKEGRRCMWPFCRHL